jgi:hypothetical protein
MRTQAIPLLPGVARQPAPNRRSISPGSIRPLACRSFMARRNLSRWRSAAPPRQAKGEKLNHRRRCRALSSRKDARSSPAFRLDLEGWKPFARVAEQAGIESAPISFSCFETDPCSLAARLGDRWRNSSSSSPIVQSLRNPTTFVQQFNTLSLW